MIFSLSDKVSGRVDFTLEQTDIFCFFHSPSFIGVPADLWLAAIATSLKMKRNVLILETPCESIPGVLTSQRWVVGATSLWLAPRSLSVLLEAPLEVSGSYNTLKIHLATFK